MKAYPKYRNTNQLWIPFVPAGWEMRKIKYSFSERVEKGYPEEPLLVASQNMGVVPKGVYGNRTVEAQKDLHLLKLVHKGDFVISLRSFQGGIEYAYYRGIISPAYTIMVNNGAVSSEYFKYLAKSQRFIELLQMCVTGIREGQNIDYKKLKNFSIPVPPRSEQNQIVKFLDWKVSKINKLISIMKRQIKIINEKEAAEISELVFGRTGNRRRKSVQVLGNIEIPDEWLVFQNKRIFKERVEHTETGLERLLSVSRHYGVKPYDELGEGEQYATIKPALSLVGYKKVFCNDLVMNIMRAQNGSYGISHYDGIVSPAYCIYKPIKRFECMYIHFLYKTPEMISAFSANSYGIVEHRRRLYPDSFLRMYTILPPLDEQKDIVQKVDVIIRHSQDSIKVLEEQVTVLQELKTRLISDVVTGKMNIQEVDIPEYEYSAEAEDAEVEFIDEEDDGQED